jgi:large subunit ribosomal protein LP1
LLDAANVEVELIWCKVFADVLAKADLNEILMNVASAPAAGGAAAPVAAASSASAAAEAPKKEEKKEDTDEDMGFGLFD